MIVFATFIFDRLLYFFQVIVLHVGTNNIEHSASEISEGIMEIVKTIREKHPNAYIVIPVSKIILNINPIIRLVHKNNIL